MSILTIKIAKLHGLENIVKITELLDIAKN